LEKQRRSEGASRSSPIGQAITLLVRTLVRVSSESGHEALQPLVHAQWTARDMQGWLVRIVNTAIINIFPTASMWHRDAVVRAASTVAARRSALFDL
jgi:hypothetical protein